MAPVSSSSGIGGGPSSPSAAGSLNVIAATALSTAAPSSPPDTLETCRRKRKRVDQIRWRSLNLRNASLISVLPTSSIQISGALAPASVRESCTGLVRLLRRVRFVAPPTRETLRRHARFARTFRTIGKCCVDSVRRMACPCISEIRFYTSVCSRYDSTHRYVQ